MRLLRTLLSALVAAGCAALAMPADAKELAHVDVIEVAGLLDSVMIDFIGDSVDAAEKGGAVVLVIQLDSPASVVVGQETERLTKRLSTAKVPIAVWVGPSGAAAGRGPSRIWANADVRGRASRTRIDALDPLPGGDPTINAPTLGDFIVGLDGRRVDGRSLDTARVVKGPSTPRREPIVAARFVKPSLIGRVLHSTVSPAIAIFLLLGGLVLVLFEFFSLGVGVAGVFGGAALVLAGYGLGELPVRAWALAAIVTAFVAFAIDLQAGQTSALWRAIGVLGLGLGTGALVDPRVGQAYVPAGIAAVLVVFAVLAGFPAMLRSRFATGPAPILDRAADKPAGQA